ncbi:MAG: DUF805 domain-containing protein [Sphingomonadales bacterium]|nr:MAG: DUF805 domain-containing protein [Sphingomonadales bacterium]
MAWMIVPLQRYFDFKGRSRRQEFWMFFLFQVILMFCASFIDVALGYGQVDSYAQATEGYSVGFSMNSSGPVMLILFLALIIPALAVAVRRLHDTDRSGWWLLLAFIPLFGWIAIFIFYCLEGTVGPNRFGEDPKGRMPGVRG